MATTGKDFDCVEMKNAAQAAMSRDLGALTDEQQRARITQELESSDDIVARKWRRLLARQTAVAK